MRRHCAAALMLLGCAHTTPEPSPTQPSPRTTETETAERGPDHGEVPGVVLPSDPATIAAGAALFGRHCAACHMPSNAYAPGPDLTDERWSHGYSPSAVHQVIWFGVPARGMPAFGGLIDEGQAAALTAFVLSNRRVEP